MPYININYSNVAILHNTVLFAVWAEWLNTTAFHGGMHLVSSYIVSDQQFMLVVQSSIFGACPKPG